MGLLCGAKHMLHTQTWDVGSLSVLHYHMTSCSSTPALETLPLKAVSLSLYGYRSFYLSQKVFTFSF